MSSTRLVLRADGGDRVGAGHVGRCLALAEAWVRTGGDALLAVTASAAAQARRMSPNVDLAILDVETGSPEDAAATTRLSAGGWLVIDGYRFDRAARPSGRGVLVIDDFGHGGRLDAEVVLDQNLGASPHCYAGRPPEARLLLGPSFALLRGGPRPVVDRTGEPRTVLVSVGGEPTDTVLVHVTAVVDALVGAGLHVDVIGGLSADDLPPAAGLTVHGFLADPAALVDGADLAVAAAGSSVYSLCRSGTPSVVVPFHDNQVPIAAEFHRAGVALTPDDPREPAGTIALVERLVADDALRARLGAAAARLVDGHGADRVVAELRRS